MSGGAWLPVPAPVTLVLAAAALGAGERSLRRHSYTAALTWTGNDGQGTADYRAYRRDHDIRFGAKPKLLGSADPAFRGDPERHSPEELLLAALSGCHMLWYLHLCADAGVVAVAYHDEAVGTMVEEEDGGGQFQEVVLRPLVLVTDRAVVELADRLHEEAHRLCFIARSVNFEVRCEATTEVAP